MTERSERLLALLPAVHRLRDAAEGGPLRALLLVLERELAAIEAAAESTWDNWFVETCEEALTPYLGDALGLPRLRGGTSASVSQRGYVANGLHRIRRRGTTAALERLARDVTGYPAYAVEQLLLTATTSHLGRSAVSSPPAGLGTVDLRHPARLDRIDRAFETFSHTADIRPLTEGVPRYNVPNIALHLWRAQPHEISRATARPVPDADDWYSFDPLGARVPLFSRPGQDTGGTGARAGGTRALSRTDLAGDPWPPVAVRVRRPQYDGGPPQEVPLVVAPWDLAERGGRRPPERPPKGTAYVDPEQGTLVLAAEDGPVDEVVVDYVQGAPGRLGAGPFDRFASWRAQVGPDPVLVQFGVARDDPAPGARPGLHRTLEESVLAWNRWIDAVPRDRRAAAVGVIVIADSRRHAAPTTQVQVPDGARLYLVAATWPIRTGPGGEFTRLPGEVVPALVRPQIAGDLTVVGSGEDSAARPGALGLNGLLVDGRVVVAPGRLDRLELVHCTVAAGIVVAKDGNAASNGGLTIDLTRTVLLGPIRASAAGGAPRVSITALRATESAILRTAVDLPGAALEVDRCTVLGTLKGRTLQASECLLDPADVRPQGQDESYEIGTRQQGFVRYCYLPDAPRAPRRYRCQPDLAVADVDPADRRAIVSRMRPTFDSEVLGTPGFLVLSPSAAAELRTTAADGGEPGVWHHLGHPLRMVNLDAALRQDLRFGLSAGAVFER
ncbi:hypothetical protein [Geodermatophilus sp. SYSU D00710]